MTTRRARLCVLGLAVLVCSTGTASAQAPPRGSGSISVAGPIRVIEADTLEIWVNGARAVVGVIGIKAPAGNTACGREAIDVVTQLVSSGIWLDEDLALPTFDRRYRRLYRLTTVGGLPLAAELAMTGLVESEPADKQSQDYPVIAAAEVQAKSAGRGCRWSSEPVPER